MPTQEPTPEAGSGDTRRVLACRRGSDRRARDPGRPRCPAPIFDLAAVDARRGGREPHCASPNTSSSHDRLSLPTCSSAIRAAAARRTDPRLPRLAGAEDPEAAAELPRSASCLSSRRHRPADPEPQRLDRRREERAFQVDCLWPGPKQIVELDGYAGARHPDRLPRGPGPRPQPPRRRLRRDADRLAQLDDEPAESPPIFAPC